MGMEEPPPTPKGLARLARPTPSSNLSSVASFTPDGFSFSAAKRVSTIKPFTEYPYSVESLGLCPTLAVCFILRVHSSVSFRPLSSPLPLPPFLDLEYHYVELEDGREIGMNRHAFLVNGF
jgi:hypothetical protein